VSPPCSPSALRHGGRLLLRLRTLGDLGGTVRLAVTRSGASSSNLRPGRRDRRYPERTNHHGLLRKPSVKHPEI